MKKYLYNSIIGLQIIITGCFINSTYSQSESGYLPSDPAYIASLPIMELTPESAALDLPSEVDNSTTIFFPREDITGDLYLYSQHGTSSCQSVSSIFNTFTYEINRLRNVASNTQQTRYAPNYSWNHLNEGFCDWQGYTSLAAVHGFLKQAGAMSDLDFDGHAQLDKDDCLRWPSGYDLYYNTLHNKLDYVETFYIEPDGTGIEILKHYLYDHNTGDPTEVGGVITFGARDYNNGEPGNSNIYDLVYPSNHEGEQVRIRMEYWSDHGHSVAIIGYSDDVMFDWGGATDNQGNIIPDGEYRNDKDNDMDGDIDMSDWEIGAVKIVNSYGSEFGDEGFEWVLYCCLPNIPPPDYNGGLNEFYALFPKETNDPGVVLKVKIEHDKREDIRLGCGYGLTADATSSVTSYDHWGYKYDGGNNSFRGKDVEGNILEGPIEILLDFDFFFSDIDYGKVFLINENSGTIPGEVEYFALVDYRWNEVFELPLSLLNFPIGSPLEAGINYDLIPHETNITADLDLFSDMVSRFNPTVSNGAKLTIEENVNIDMYNSNININSGSSLVIEDNATIVAKRGICKIIIEGNVSMGNNVNFLAEGEAQLHLMINNPNIDLIIENANFTGSAIIAYNNELSVSYSNFTNGGIWGFKGNFYIKNSEFISSFVNISNADGNERYVYIENCNFSGLQFGRAIDIDYYPDFNIENCTIHNCISAINLYNCGYGKMEQKISGCKISNNDGTGINIYNSSVDVIHNGIENNIYGIRCFDKSMVHLEGDYNLVSQKIKDNNGYEVYASEVSFPYYFRGNLIKDDDNLPGDPLVKYTGTSGIGELLDVEKNCWGYNFDANTDLEPKGGYDWQPVWECLNGPGTGTSLEAENMFFDAKAKIEAEDYVDAKTDFQEIVLQYPTSKYAQASLKELYSLEAFVTNDYADLKSYYASEPNIVSDPELSKLADFLINFCEIKLENWPTAIAWFENVIQNPETMEDSIFAIIDLGYTYFLMENSGQKAAYAGALTEHIPVSQKQFEENRNFLLSLLPGNQMSETMKENINNLKTGELLQNVPNPFSSTTQIWYKIEEESSIVINIFDYTGKLITSFNPGTKDKGSHYIEFDGSGLPNGIYFYSIKINGKTTDSRKMTLTK